MSGVSEAGLVRLLFAIQFVTMGAMEMSGPFWPVRVRELGGAGAAAGVADTLVYVAPMLGIAATGAFWGRMGDRYGHRAMMLRALAGLALTQLALALATDVWLVLVLRFIQGACAGFSAPAQAYGVSLVAQERRGRLFAFLQISTNVGSLAGAVFGGWLLDRAGFAMINLGAATLCAASFGAVVVLLPAVAASPRGTGRGRDRAEAGACTGPVLVPLIVGLLVVHAALLATRLMPQSIFSLYVASTFVAPHWLVGLCYGLLATGFIVSALWWARVFERRGLSEALRLLGGVVLACGVLTAAAAATRDIVLFAALQFLWGVCLGATTPVLTALVSRAAPADRQGQVLGIVQSTAQIASITGIALGGAVAALWRPGAVYPAVSGLYVATAILILVVERRFAGTFARAAVARPTTAPAARGPAQPKETLP
ncbi:MFS transporter [Methyloraptor flagellatus]|uniref:MFS transporter n=1 Tax=Methyloraptor flagellatus TaxID=3162530 RepID=A0AAU7XFK1_9HYPH